MLARRRLPIILQKFLSNFCSVQWFTVRSLRQSVTQRSGVSESPVTYLLQINFPSLMIAGHLALLLCLGFFPSHLGPAPRSFHFFRSRLLGTSATEVIATLTCEGKTAFSPFPPFRKEVVFPSICEEK